MLHDRKKNTFITTEIGKLIDELVEDPKTIKIQDSLQDSINNERLDTYYCDIKDKQLYTQSVTEDGRIVWKHIEAITKHLPINRDGTNTLLEVKTRSGRIVKGTKAKSFLTRVNNIITPIRGDELKIGTMVPIIMKSSNDRYDDYLNIEQYLPKDMKSKIPEKMELDRCFGFYIGAFLSEGCLSETYVAISNNDEKYRNKVIEFCDRYNIRYHVVRKKIDVPMATERAFDIRIHSTILARLTKIWCGKLAYNKRVPEFAFNAKTEFISGLLDSYISGDGTVCKDGYIRASSVSKLLIEGIGLLLTRFGIFSKFGTATKTNLETNNIRVAHTLSIRNKNINKFKENVTLTIDDKKIRINNLCLKKFKKDCDMYDKMIVSQVINSDVYYDEIIQIKEVQPSRRYVYDLTVKDTLTFCLLNGLCIQDSFHHSGIAAISPTTQGVPRIKELLSLTKNLKTPQMIIYPTKEYMGSRDMANKIASYIIFTTLGNIRNRLSVYYDPDPYRKGGFMEQDNVNKVFSTKSTSKYSCQADFAALPWLMRIEFNRESLFEKEVTLLDIKSKFCNAWEKRHSDKSLKKEEKYVLEKVIQLAILSNTDYDKIPILHIRFDMLDFDISTLNDFIEYVIDKFKLKGISSISNISTINEERVLAFDNENNDIEKKKQYVIYTMGTNLYDIRYLNGIDINRTITNDVIAMYETFGIEAARSILLREIIYAYERAGSGVNYHHVSVLIDLMTFNGYMTSIDRHGMNKSDVGPLSRASFEKTVDQLQTAAIFGEIDYMNGVSSRIMAGLVIKGGTGLCNIILDTDMIQNSEFTEDIGQKYVKTYNDISGNNIMSDIINRTTEENDMFIPV